MVKYKGWNQRKVCYNLCYRIMKNTVVKSNNQNDDIPPFRVDKDPKEYSEEVRGYSEVVVSGLLKKIEKNIEEKTGGKKWKKYDEDMKIEILRVNFAVMFGKTPEKYFLDLCEVLSKKGEDK